MCFPVYPASRPLCPAFSFPDADTCDIYHLTIIYEVLTAILHQSKVNPSFENVGYGYAYCLSRGDRVWLSHFLHYCCFQKYSNHSGYQTHAMSKYIILRTY